MARTHAHTRYAADFWATVMRPRCELCGYRSRTSKASWKARGLCVWCVARLMDLLETT